MICPSCQAENDDADQVCFSCRHVLVAVSRGFVMAGRYEILSCLGKGGMGAVYKAHDRVLEETVAIKLLRPDIAQEAHLARRLRSEVKLARKVTHKNVCRIHEYGEDQGLRYICMEYIDGVDLKQIVREAGGLSPVEGLDIAIQLAQGLEAIHDVGIIHRDLKTLNIMRDARGIIRLMDFGIAKQTGGDSSTGGTATGQVVGTPEYMSPEQARGQKVDFRSDIYALGVVIFEIFAGQVPFKGDTPVATLLMHVQERPPLEGARAQRIPEPVVPVLRKALAKDPVERFATALEMAEALEGARATTLSGNSPAQMPPPTRIRTGGVAGAPTTSEGVTPPPEGTTVLDAPTPTPEPIAPQTPRGPALPTSRGAELQAILAEPAPHSEASPPRPVARQRAPWPVAVAALVAIVGIVLVVRGGLWRTASKPPDTAASIPAGLPSSLVPAPPSAEAVQEEMQAVQGLLSQATLEFDGPLQSRSIGFFGEIVARLETLRRLGTLPPRGRDMLAQAYELRGRAYYNIRLLERATDDFRSLFRINPGYVSSKEKLSPELVEFINLVKKSLVGSFAVSSKPAGARVLLNGEFLGLTDFSPREVLAGEYTVEVALEGYRTERLAVVIPPAATESRQVELVRNNR